MDTKVNHILNVIQNHRILSYIIAGLIILGLIATFVINITDAGSRIYGLFASSSDAIISEPKNATSLENGPCGFDIHDPDLLNVKTYDLRKDMGSSISIGPCPEVPCFVIRYEGLNMMADPPEATLSISGNLGRLYLSQGGIAIAFYLKKGTGFRLLGEYYDLIFEIQDDQIDFIRAWAAIKVGTGEPGSVFLVDRYSCRN